MALSSVSVVSNSLRLRRVDVRADAPRQRRRGPVARLRDASFLAVTALLAVGIAAGVMAADNAIEASAQPVTIVARDVTFQPAEIHVKAGQWVSVRLVNEDPVFHDWMVMDVANVDIPSRPGQTSSTRFVIDRPGTYTYICTVPGHEAAGMTGTLIVE